MDRPFDINYPLKLISLCISVHGRSGRLLLTSRIMDIVFYKYVDVEVRKSHTPLSPMNYLTSFLDVSRWPFSAWGSVQP